MNLKKLLPIALLSAMMVSACTTPGTSTSTSTPAGETHGVTITNKEAITAAGFYDTMQRELEIALTPEGNVLLEMTNGNLTVESSDTSIVSVILVEPSGYVTSEETTNLPSIVSFLTPLKIILSLLIIVKVSSSYISFISGTTSHVALAWEIVNLTTSSEYLSVSSCNNISYVPASYGKPLLYFPVVLASL